MKNIKKVIYYILAWLFLIIGIVGIFLPLVPTTGPLIFASFFFVKSSARMHKWLVEHPVFGAPIRQFLIERAIPLRAKIIAISSIWISISLSAVFFTSNLYVRIALFSIALGLSVYLIRFKTAR